jgi:hypothetical protein
MTSTIKNISLYIPHIFGNFSKEDVTDIFETLKIGKVNKIDFIPKMGKDRKEYNAAYVHFEFWYNNRASVNFQNRVLNPEEEARLIYDEPWYWIVLENKGQKIQPGQRKTRINLGDLNAISIKSNCPSAPIKQYKTIQNNIMKPINLISELDESVELNEDEIAMEECEAEMEKDDHYLAYFDKRYVQTIEEENQLFRREIYQLQNALYTEQIKSSALVEYIAKLHK